MRTIVIINQKGGCGKTTTSINLAACFAARGVRTLLVDMDPQSHCAVGLGVPESVIDLDVSHALRSPMNAPLARDRYVTHVSRGLDLLASSMMLAGLESARGGLADQPEKERRLRSVIDRLTVVDPSRMNEDGEIERRYDVCLIDCSPSIGLLSYNAIAAGREVIIPVETSYFSLKGAAKQVQTVRSMARRLGMRIQPRILATMHDPNLPLARDLLEQLRAEFGETMIPVQIRVDQALKEAASFGVPVESHAPGSMGAEDYRSLTEWLMEHASIERPEPWMDGADGIDGEDPEEIEPVGEVDREVRAPVSAPTLTASVSRAQEMAMRARELSGARTIAPARPVAIELENERGLMDAQAEAETAQVSGVVTPEVETARADADGADVTPDDRVRHLYGVRAVDGGLLFVQPIGVGEEVRVAASFNAWNPALSPMTRNEALGVHELLCSLEPGEYQYKLVVDGLWTLDTFNVEVARNGIGSENNVARVRG
jgi:chromosome partitioning protein